MNDYLPVACSFHDRLEHLAIHRRQCRVRYLEDGREKLIEGRIQDILTTEGAEYLVLSDGAAHVRLDRILEITAADTQPR